jgi:hypothetical protein
MEDAGRTELRLGLVLYGGVSLAVYIYGVVCEVQRLLEGSAELEAARADGEEDSDDLGAYAKALRDANLSGAVVDVIAGTSAGGINGVLLAKALATGADVREVKDLWIDGGDIGTLMNKLDADKPPSLLSTKEFERRLREGFDRLDARGSGGDPDAALDLFVSTTHLRGDRREFMDALGRGIESLVHRFVIHLKQRPSYRTDFLDPEPDEGTPAGPVNQRLVKLSRATSAFPVAFEPVLLEGEELLGPHAEEKGWFADGGILNNKPFTDALRTIFARSSPERPVRRWLLSVDPDPKSLAGKPVPGPEPAFDQVLGAAVAAIPRYQSIASDLEDLEAHNASVKRVARTVLDLEAGLANRGAGSGDLSPGFDTTYRELRRRALSRRLAEQLIDAVRPANRKDFDPEATEAALAEGAYQAVVEREGSSQADAPEFAEEDALPSDPAFQLRRVYYLIKLLGMSRGPAEEDREAFTAVRGRLWEEFEAISNSLWETLAFSSLPLGEDDGSTLDSHGQAFEVARERVRTGWDEMASRSSGVDDGLRGGLEGVTVLLPTGGEGDGDAQGVVTVPLIDVYDSFPTRDFFLLSIEAGGGVRFRDVVNHAQISPESATATKVEAGLKLAGDTAGHFGGFLEREWRVNDARWGRLDAAEVIMRVILAETPPARQDEGIEAVCQEVLGEDCKEALDSPDWREYLADHAIGGVTMDDLDPHRRTGLGYRAAVVMRGMLKRASSDANTDGASASFRAHALRAADKVVGRALGVLFLPRWILERRWRKDARKTETTSSPD